VKKISSGFTLSKAERLKSRKEIEQLFSEGKSFSLFPLKVIYQIDDQPAIFRSGFTVSSNKFKKASDRNRIKRLLRECYRLQKQLLPPHLGRTCAIFFIYIGNALPKYSELFAKMGLALGKINILLREDSALHT
jgi:ribonuclease P protein component